MDKTDIKSAKEELTMILLYLSHLTRIDRFTTEENKDNKYAWKGYDFDILNKLDEEDYIIQSSHRAKSVYITEKGEAR